MKQPTPILFVIDYFRDPNAGTEGQLKQLIDHLDRERFAPRLLVFKASDYFSEQGFSCPVSVLGKQSLTSPAMWWALYRFARAQYRQGVRLAHVYFNDASVIGPPVFAAAGIRTIISRRDMGYWYTPLYRSLLRVTRRFVALAIVNSQAVGEVTTAVEGIDPDRIKVIYNGFRPQSPDHEAVPELANIRNSLQLVAGLVANIRPIKRMQDAIAAVAELAAGDVAVQLVIIGAGDSSELAAMAGRLDIADRVHFLGGRSDVQRCLEYFDVALLCSESEGFSNAIVEYQFAGLPVICTATGGNPEAIIEGDTGLLYPVGEVSALAAHLRLLVEDSDRRLSMGQAAAGSARQRFSVDQMVAEHQQVYANLLDSR